MGKSPDYLIIGAGIFGVTAALALRERGRSVTIVDPGPVPHPLAATNDISKAIRMEYGADADYMALVEQALPGWRQWNDLFGETLFHETGVMMLSKGTMAAGGFEFESYQMLLRRGHQPERLDAAEIVRRFPAWKPDTYVDGFFHSEGGYVESGRTLAALVSHAIAKGVGVRTGEAVTGLVVEDSRCLGVRLENGDTLSAEHVIVAAGAWTPLLAPGLEDVMVASGHPVFHLQAQEPARFEPPNFAVFTADIANTGWYGFPRHPREQVVKIANHGPGRRLHARDDERIVGESDVAALRAFLTESLPELATASIVYTRRCFYCDTLDEHLWIDRHPEIAGLTVASGGSGHGFKFAPILGDLVADAAEDEPNAALAKFRWRTLATLTAGEEAARFHG